jgi:long-chain acyl-CoA synthetase
LESSRDTRAWPWLAHYPPGMPERIDPGPRQTVVHLLDEAAARFGDREQAVFLGSAFTFARIDTAGRHLAAWLAARELGPGSRVAVMMPNVPQYLAALAGILRAGAAVVNVNPLYTARELSAQLDDADAGALIVLENFAATAQAALRERPPVPVLVASLGDWLGPVKGPVVNFVLRRVRKAVPPWSLPGALAFDEAIAQGSRLSFTPPAVAPGDVAMLQYTGGTTGVSKGAMLTHANLVAAALSAHAWLRPALPER